MSGLLSLSITVPPAVGALAQFPPALLQAVAAALDLENELTVGHVQATKLSQRGPDTLGVVTNRLRSSLRPSKAQIVGQAVVSAIGTPVVYAGPHESGFEGDVQVRAFTRRVTQVFGQRLRRATTAQVAPHRRHLKIRARRWLSRGIEERGPAYSQAISTAITTTWEGLR